MAAVQLDVTFPGMPCGWMSLDAMDVSGELELDVDHDITKRRLSRTGAPLDNGEKHDVRHSSHRRLQLDEALIAFDRMNAALALLLVFINYLSHDKLVGLHLQCYSQSFDRRLEIELIITCLAKLHSEFCGWGTQMGPKQIDRSKVHANGTICGDCYGAQSHSGQCCDTCDSVCHRRASYLYTLSTPLFSILEVYL